MSAASLMPLLPCKHVRARRTGRPQWPGKWPRGHKREKLSEVIGPSPLTGCDLGSGALVGVAPNPIQNTPEVLTQHPNRFPVLWERVAVSNPDDHRHDPLEVRFEPDILLDVGPGWRHIAHLGVFTRLPEVLLDRVLHQSGL